MTECNKRGIRAYVVVVNGYYRIEIELNKTKMFLVKDIKKIIKGEKLYKPVDRNWAIKIDEIYKHFYEKEIIKKRKQVA